MGVFFEVDDLGTGRALKCIWGDLAEPQASVYRWGRQSTTGDQKTISSNILKELAVGAFEEFPVADKESQRRSLGLKSL